jgi:CRP/FNR family transcriptional regulator, cAMP and macrophage regulator
MAVDPRGGPVLSAADLRWLRPACDARRVEAGECLFREGATVDAVYIIRRGTVAISRVLGERHVMLTLLGLGSIVGDEALLAQSPATFDAWAFTNVDLFALPAPQFFLALQEVPVFAARWAIWSVDRLGAMQGRVGELLAGDLQSQIASLLLRESTRTSSIALTQQTIADLLGVHRTSVTRVLHELGRRGLVRVGYAHIGVISQRGLALVAEGHLERIEATGA